MRGGLFSKVLCVNANFQKTSEVVRNVSFLSFDLGASGEEFMRPTLLGKVVCTQTISKIFKSG